MMLECLPPPDTKTCVRCKSEKPSAEFRVRSERLMVPLHAKCKRCENQISAKRIQEYRHGERIPFSIPKRNRLSDAERAYKYRYGITKARAEELLHLQGGVCKICGIQGELGYQKFVVYHDHATGKIRGVLCSQCNFGLGCFKDKQELLIKAKDYLGMEVSHL